MFTRLSRLRLLSVLLTLVLVAPPLGGRWSARPVAQAAGSQTSATTSDLIGVACPSLSTCVAVGDQGGAVTGTLLRTRHGGRSSGGALPTTNPSLPVDETGQGQGSHRR